MFLYIDDKIITSFQWIIRQIELFTQFTRKDVGTVVKHIQLIFGALCVLTGTLCLIFGIKESLLLLISFPIFGLSVFHNSIAIDITQQKESNGILPENIVREYKLRRLTASIMLNFFLCTTILPLVAKSPEEFDRLISLFRAVLLEHFILLLGLYFLCTTSLPPGEKQKKLLERESRKLTPVPIKN